MDPSNDYAPVDVALCIDREVYARLWEVIRHLCVGLVDLNVGVRLLCSSPEIEALTLGPIQTIVHEELTWPLRRSRLRQIIDALAGRKPTAVHALARGSFWAAQALAEVFAVDLVVHLTSVDDVRSLHRLHAGTVQHVIAASQPLFEAACRARRVPLEAITLIRPGVLRSDAPTCFQRPDRVPAVLCTANLEPDSGAEQLVHAIRILRDEGVDLLAFFSGEGRGEGQLRRLVRSHKVSPWVTFARPRADTTSLLSGADVWVSPAPEQAISAGSLLAMATGTAVVACAGGVTDHCVDGQTAIVCPNGEPKSLADGIRRLVSDPGYARSLAAAGLAHMKQHHAVSAMAEQVMARYQHLRQRRQTLSPVR